MSKDEIPQFGKLTGASIDINKEIADASLAGGIFSGFGNHNDTDRIYGYFPELSGGDGKSGV